jgi:hypothetical protein
LEREAKFFDQHPDYKSYAHTMGIPYLSKRLNVILISHIKRCIPSLNKQIASTLQDKERELAQYSLSSMSGDPLFEVDSGPLVLALINKFINAYGDKIEGRFVKESAVEI